MRRTVHVCVTAWGYLHLFGVGCISTWLPVCEEQSEWLNSNGENLRFKSVGRTLPNVTAVAFISPGETTQRIKRDTSMTYERRGIPPLYVRACGHLYRKRGSSHESTFITVKDNGHTGTNCFPPDCDGRFPNWKVAFRHCHRFHSGRAPPSLLSLFCLCIDVDPPFLSKFTMVSCCHCFVIRLCSYFQCWASARRRDEGPLKPICWSSAAVHVSGLKHIKGPRNNKKLQLYVGGWRLSRTFMLVEVVCSPFYGVSIMEGENAKRVLIKHDCQVFWCSQLMLKLFDLTQFFALAVSFWGRLRFPAQQPFWCCNFLIV